MIRIAKRAPSGRRTAILYKCLRGLTDYSPVTGKVVLKANQHTFTSPMTHSRYPAWVMPKGKRLGPWLDCGKIPRICQVGFHAMTWPNIKEWYHGGISQILFKVRLGGPVVRSPNKVAGRYMQFLERLTPDQAAAALRRPKKRKKSVR